MTYIRASPATLGFDPPSNRLSLPPAAPIQRNSNDILVALFRKGTDPRTIITLDKPLSFRWKILEKLNEYEDQATVEQNKAYGFRSFASAKFLCCDPQRYATKAFMRVYIQVPHRTTEMDDADTRRQQATKWTPQELASLLDLTGRAQISHQSSSDTRPFRVGSSYGLFGKLFRGYALAILMALAHFGILKAVKERREQIRVAFLKALAKPKEYGWYPIVNKARSLVWHRETQTLYFIGRFSKTMEGEPRRLAEPAQRIATFELAIPDVPVRWKDWDKYTSRWKW
ncbi:hypothetical protein N7491_008417 [Penicillium cf. griseofulvum]|nr:hypothetical protein N7491_008417 [Penicillium cf. griseofulvum]